jgi:hypothetical protein
MSPPVPWGFISAGLPIHRRPFTPTTLLRLAALRIGDRLAAAGSAVSRRETPLMNPPEPIIGVSHQIGQYADAIRVPTGYEQIITSGTRG